MHRPNRLHITLAAVALAAGIAGARRRAAAPRRPAWTRISGPTQPGAQLGLARTADGVLHVIWNRGATNTSIFETRFSAAGKMARHVGGRHAAGPATAGSRSSSCRTGRCVCSPQARTASRRSRRPLPGRAGPAQPVAAWGGAVAEASGDHRRDADEGRSAGHGLARHRRGRRPSRLDPAERLRGRHGRVVPGHRCRNRRSRPVGRDERRARRRLRPADPPEPRAARPDAAPGQGLERQLERADRREPASSWRTPTASRCASPATAAARRRSRPARTSAQPSAPVLRGGSGSPGATRATVSSSPASNRAAGAFEPVQKLRGPSSAGLTFVQCEGSAGPAGSVRRRRHRLLAHARARAIRRACASP